MRERVLKLSSVWESVKSGVSLPMRERVLKLYKHDTYQAIYRVAPHAGACVETVGFANGVFSGASLPMRERVLKHHERQSF